ncbi:MAG: salicylate hydroxylase [Betaproteobacteria bacterium RIFCSPLOWO2_02_FULL_65_20]|nr:MAG: salicylate hydroxylase [Betaproteobacteria bacterium RIFCSPLOWO2_02_FULL_65_20]
MARKDLPILVVGGGIGGLAAALALSKKGRAVQVLEQAPTFAEIGAGIQLGPNVFKMFDYLGLTEAIDRTAVYPGNLIMRDALTGEELIRVPVGSEAFRAKYKFPYGVIHRADIHTAFLEACRKSPLVTLSASQKVAGYEDKGDRVAVSTEGGASFEGELLIGADGLWSKVREQLVGDAKPRVSGHIAYRAVIPTPKVPSHLQQNDVVLWGGPKTHLVHYPLRRGEVYNLVVVFHSSRYEEGWDTYGDPDELRERFRGERPEVLEFLAMVDAWKMWVLCDREPIKGWSKGRIVLLGDAAHPMLQYLAQGACMATEDAVVLANKLETSKGDHASAFAAYEQDRYLRTARVQLTARFYGEIYHATDVRRDLRNSLLKATSPEAAINGPAWLYGGIEV